MIGAGLSVASSLQLLDARVASFLMRIYGMLILFQTCNLAYHFRVLKATAIAGSSFSYRIEADIDAEWW